MLLKRRRTKSYIFLHFVWATFDREPLLSIPAEESLVHRWVQAEAERLGCVVRAVNGMPDHVHLVVQIPAKLSAASLAQAVKGVSSKAAKNELNCGGVFRWQEGYGVFSVSRGDLKRVIAYVENQKEHHRLGTLISSLEDVDELVDEEPGTEVPA